MNQLIIVTILFVIALQGCTDLGTTPEPKTAVGKFVVDSFDVACTVKTNPNNDSLWAYFPYTLIYHFEGLPGTINHFTIWAVNREGMGMFIDYAYPDSVNKRYTWSFGFWARSALVNVDSVDVNCSLSGPFWNYPGEFQGFAGSFEWNTTKRVPVRRQ